MKKTRGRRALWLGLAACSLAAAVAAGAGLRAESAARAAAEKEYAALTNAVNEATTPEKEKETAPESGSVVFEPVAGEPVAEKASVAAKSSAQAGELVAAVKVSAAQPLLYAASAGTSAGKVQAAAEKEFASADAAIPEKNLDWEALHEKNADIYAWIYVPGTKVDYPVLQHPTDDSFYLNHNMDGSKGYPGCIYTERYNAKDFTSPHTVLYGHNMKNKSMFATLLNFTKKSMVTDDHYIYVYTPEKNFVYRIFAAYEYSAIHLLANYDMSNEYVYEQYIRDILKMDSTDARVANIRHDVEVTKKDRIITLSTCTSDHDVNRRFLVTGVLLNP